jgi:hypothetical protein
VPALYSPERHEPLADIAWDPARAKAAISEIAAETILAMDERGFWANHPNDQPDDMPAIMNLYFGAAGVIWALDYLAVQGVADRGAGLSGRLPNILARNRRNHEALKLQQRGYLVADAGIQLLQYKLAPSAKTAEALATTIADNLDDPAIELMWGAPGTMLASLFMGRMTGEARWAELFRQGAERLETGFAVDETLGSAIWRQDLYGRQPKAIGAVHGFAGNAFVLWAGREFFTPEAWRKWAAGIAKTFRATAQIGDESANWSSKILDGDLLLQHCHGAPGMITCLGLLDAPIDDLLLAGGELTWRAGPLIKGANLCHGTAGNGYAFLKLFERTGDQLWLDRARRFAMHAIAQSEADAAQFGRRRHSLWTGDLGLACYLLDCLEAKARFPTLDVF